MAILHPKPETHPNHLLLEVPKSAIEIPDRIQQYAAENGFEAKSEYHVTVLGRLAAELIEASNLQPQVERFVSQVALWNMHPADCYVELEKHDDVIDAPKHSIVQMVYIEEMLNLYKRLRSQITRTIPTPPAHITLFTKGSASGIGVHSAKDLEACFVKCL